MKKLRLVLILAGCISVRSLVAATITTELSADETSVQASVTLQVRVNGTTNVDLPNRLDVDGLDISLRGRQAQTEIDLSNRRMVASGVYTYLITPLREGTFEIPPIELNVDGHMERTTAQKLLVQPGTAPAPRSAPAMPMPPGGSTGRRHSSAPPDDGKLASAEIIIPKKSIYVGEVVPVEIRFYLSENAGFRLLQEPQVSGEGFTVQKLSPATQTQEVIGQNAYRVIAYKTSITAVKSGEMALPSVEFHGVISVPTKSPSNMNSIFDQMLGGMGMTENSEVNIKSDTKSIRVKALPGVGRPANFSGAVGDFTIAASADPTKVAAGDPVTLKVAISGRGNFDAMGDPKLLDADDWKTYPPTSRFEKADEFGYSGTRTFETPMVALKPQTHTPVVEFSYFDPEKEKYFTLKSQPVAIEAAADQVAPSTTAEATPVAKPSATPAANQAGGWVVHSTPRSWQPLVKRPGFWIFNAAAAAALIGVISAMAVRRARQGPAGHRAARVRDRDRLVGELGRTNLPDDAFYARALEVLTLQASLVGEAGPFELVRSLETQGRNVSDLHAVLARADEIKFSGGGNVATRLDAEERRRVVRAILEACR